MKFNKFLKALGAVAVIALTVIISMLAMYGSGKPSASHNYVADVNQSIAETPVESRGWPIYRPQWIEFGLCMPQQKVFYDIYVYEGDRSGKIVSPIDAEWKTCVARLSDLKPLLDVTREGAKRPILGLELQASPDQYSFADRQALFPTYQASNSVEGAEEFPSLYKCGLHHATPFRQLAAALVADARLAMEQDDWQRATDNVNAIFGISRQLSGQGFFVTTSIASSIYQNGVTLLSEIIHDPRQRLDANQLRSIRAVLNETKEAVRFLPSNDQLAMTDAVQHIYTDNGNGDGWITTGGQKWIEDVFGRKSAESEMPPFVEAIVRKANAVRMPSRKQTVEAIDELFELAKKDFETPLWQSADSQVDSLLANKRDEIKYRVVDMLFPTTGQFRKAQFRSETLRQTADSVVAANLFKLKQGRWPKDFDELVDGELLQAAPLDPFTGNPLIMKTDPDKGLIVYSFGANQIDEGGDPMTSAESVGWGSDNLEKNRGYLVIMAPDPSRKGDWLIWPIEDKQ